MIGLYVKKSLLLLSFMAFSQISAFELTRFSDPIEGALLSDAKARFFDRGIILFSGGMLVTSSGGVTITAGDVIVEPNGVVYLHLFNETLRITVFRGGASVRYPKLGRGEVLTRGYVLTVNSGSRRRSFWEPHFFEEICNLLSCNDKPLFGCYPCAVTTVESVDIEPLEIVDYNSLLIQPLQGRGGFDEVISFETIRLGFLRHSGFSQIPIKFAQRFEVSPEVNFVLELSFSLLSSRDPVVRVLLFDREKGRYVVDERIDVLKEHDFFTGGVKVSDQTYDELFNLIEKKLR